MNIGAQNASDGKILFVSEFNGNPMSLSGSIAIVRVHSEALTPAQILNNFNEDKDRFGATIPVAPVDMLSDGTIDLDTPDFNLRLVRSSLTVAALNPKGAGTFDFTPADRLPSRKSNGYVHLGDLTLRLRQGTEGTWTSYSTAAAREPVIPLATEAQVLAAADLSPTLPANCPLSVRRNWELEDGRLVLRFVLTNKTDSVVQIGAIGIPMIFNNYITGRSLTQAHEICSFSDPYVGLDGGYLQVTRLKGSGPTLLVVPQGKTPFEAYNPLLNEPTSRSQTFEGFYEWMVHSQAWAENEWASTQPWNKPTLKTLDPGASVSYGLKFLVSDEIRHIDQTLEANKRPVAIGVPGYILPQGLEGRLFLKYSAAVQSMAVEPAGAIQCTQDEQTPGGWQAFALRGQTWGRARLLVNYTDGTQQSIHYTVTKPMAEAVADLGRFLFTRQWYTDANDPFGRAPSVISFDREVNQPVLQDDRVWIAGLQDEAGAGSWLAAAMKEFGQPSVSELAQYEQFVDGVLWGRIQYSEPFYNSDVKTTHPQYSVRRSVFFYQPECSARLHLHHPQRVEPGRRLQYLAFLQLPARGCRQLGDVQAGPQQSRPGQEPPLAVVSGSRLACRSRHGHGPPGGVRRDRPDGGDRVHRDPEGPPARGDDGRGCAVRGRHEGPRGPLELPGLSLRQRDGVGLHGPGGGLRLVQVLRLQRQGGRDAQRDPGLHADRAALGLQRQCLAVLGLPIRREDPADRATDPSLRIGHELHPGPGRVPRAAR